MATDFIPKFAGLFVVLILVLVVAVPVVSTMSTTTETVTTETEHEVVNDIVGYSKTVDMVVHGNSPTAPDPGYIGTSNLVEVTPRYLVTVPDIYVGGGGSYGTKIWYFSENDNDWTYIDLTTYQGTYTTLDFAPDALDIPELYALELNVTLVQSVLDEQSRYLWKIWSDATDYDHHTICIPLMHFSYAGSYENDLSLTETSFRCNVLGENSYYLSPDDEGDYVAIPFAVFEALYADDKTVSVVGGATYYAPNTSNALTGYVAPDDTGVYANYDLTFTALNDDATLYSLTNGNMGLSFDVDSYWAVAVPYDASYTVTETETITVELIPMGDLLVAILILFAVILAVGLLARTNGGF